MGQDRIQGQGLDNKCFANQQDNKRPAKQTHIAVGKSWTLLRQEEKHLEMAATKPFLHDGRPVHTDHRHTISYSYVAECRRNSVYTTRKRLAEKRSNSRQRHSQGTILSGEKHVGQQLADTVGRICTVSTNLLRQ